MSVRQSLAYLLGSFSRLVDQTPVNRLSIADCEPSSWKLIFFQSRVNGAQYRGEEILPYWWDWPQQTYFQKRVRDMRQVQMKALKRTSTSRSV